MPMRSWWSASLFQVGVHDGRELLVADEKPHDRTTDKYGEHSRSATRSLSLVSGQSVARSYLSTTSGRRGELFAYLDSSPIIVHVSMSTANRPTWAGLEAATES